MFSVRSPTSARLGAALSAAPRAPAVERISTGARINRAADDAANLGVGTKLRTQARSLAMARRNVNDALRASEVASSGLGEITDRLQRMRELAVAAASETLTDTEREYLQAEYGELVDEIDRAARATDLGGQRLLSPYPVDIAITIDSSDSMFLELPSIQAELPALATLLADAGIEARFAIVDMNTFSDLGDGSRVLSPLGANLAGPLSAFALTGVGGMDPYSVMLDLAGIAPLAGTTTPEALLFDDNAQQKIFIHISDVGRETLLTGVTQGQAANLLAANGFTVHTITGAAADPTYTTLTSVTGGTLNNMTGFGLGVDTAVQNIANSIIANFVDAETISVQAGTDGSAASVIELAYPVNVTAHALGVDDTAITTAAGALDALAQLDEALHAVNGHQADLGASQNRLEAALNHQQAAIEASTRSEGAIMDADYALELSELSKHQVMIDARTATLAQARQLESSAFAALMS